MPEANARSDEKKLIDWHLDDTKDKPIEEVRKIRDEIDRKSYGAFKPKRRCTKPKVRQSPHRITVFTAGCPLCTEIVNEIEVGKCARCELIVYNVSEHATLVGKYGVRVVPTVIIDDEVKIEGRPDIPFVCDEGTYNHFRGRYPMKTVPH